MPLEDAERYYSSIGKLLPETEARLIDEDGNDVPIGMSGELLIRSPSVMK